MNFMKEINHRYVIIDTLQETPNSIIYKVNDVLSEGNFILKMRNNNAVSPLPVEVFRAEFDATFRMRFPLIRESISFENVRVLDGEAYEGDDVCIITPYAEMRTVDSSKKLSALQLNQLMSTLLFLHRNGYSHGDIRYENMYLDAREELNIFDLAPIFDADSSAANDIRKINELFFSSYGEKKKLLSITDFLTSPYADSDELLRIQYTHIENTVMPMSLLAANDTTLIMQSVLLLYHEGDCYNAFLRITGLYPYLMEKGYWVLALPNIHSHEYLTIVRQCIAFLYKIKCFKTIIDVYGAEFCKIAPELPFTPSPALRTASDEEKKLLEYSVMLIEEVTRIQPICFVIRDLSQADPASIAFLQLLNERIASQQCIFLAAHTQAINALPSYESRHFTIEEIKTLLTYYFYLYPLRENVVEEVYECTGGEPVTILEGLNACVREKGIQVVDGYCTLKDKTEHYFDVIGNVLAAIDAFTTDDTYILEIFVLFKGVIDEQVYVFLTDTIKNKIHDFIHRNYAWSLHGKVLVRYPRMINDRILSVENPYLKELYLVLQHSGGDDHTILSAYVALGLLFDSSERIFEHVERFTVALSDNDRIHTTHNLFLLYQQFLPYQDQFSDANIVLLNKRMLELDINRSFDSAIFTEAIKKHARTDTDWYIYYDYHILRDVLEKNEIISLSVVFDEFGKVDNALWGDTVGALLLKYTHLNMFDECLDIIETKINPHFDELTLQSRATILTAKQNCYQLRRQIDKALETAAQAYDLYIKNPDQIAETTVFAVMNNYIIALRHAGNIEKALEILEFALENAQKRHNKRDIAAMYINKGNLASQKNTEATLSYNREALQIAIRIKEYRMMIISSLNILQQSYINLDYSIFEDILRDLYVYFEKFQVKLEQNHLHYFLAHYLLICGEYSQCGDYFQAAAQYVADSHSLTFSSIYVVNYYKYLSITESPDRAYDYIDTLLRDEAFQKTDIEVFQLLADVVMFYVYIGQRSRARDFFNTIKPPHDYESAMHTYTLLAWFFSSGTKSPRIPLAGLIDPSTELFYYYTFLTKKSQKDVQYYEILSRYCLLLQRAIFSLPENVRINAWEKGYYAHTHASFVKRLGIDIYTFNPHTIRKKLSKKIELYCFRNSQKKASSCNNKLLTDVDTAVEIVLKEICAISHYDRGIYFTYNFTDGWNKKSSVFDDFGYHEHTPYNQDLIKELVYRSNTEPIVHIENDSFHYNAITETLIIPIVDISKYREHITPEYSSSFTQMLAIRGCLYFDTKQVIARPEKSEITVFVQRYLNAVFYYSYLKDAMLIDQLTKLYKRENWFAIVKDMLAVSKDSQQPCVVIMTDIDHFKSINDMLGHKTGDTVLTQVAQAAMSALRIVDAAGRYGGEEFIFFAQIKSYNEAEVIAERIRVAVESASILADRKVTLSAGVACFPRDGELLDELILKADKAMLFAKESGRNRVMIWDENCSITSDIAKSHAVIENPSREMYKIDAIIAIADTLTEKMSVEELLHKAFEILQKTCSLSDMAVEIGSHQEVRLYTLLDTFDISKADNGSGSLTDYFSKLASKTFADRTITLYAEKENDMIAFKKEEAFFSLIGKMIIDKLISALLSS